MMHPEMLNHQSSCENGIKTTPLEDEVSFRKIVIYTLCTTSVICLLLLLLLQS